MFVDGTQAAGLREPSISVLGFGTQFLDADLDGWPDLIVANGHVDDFRYKGVPYEMRAQVFYNFGGARFRELDAARLGAYFEDTHLGRGLCLLDWNRDGREDAAVTHLDDPAALLTNVTLGTGRCVTLRLIGVEGDRDAVGAVVGVTAGGRSRTRQLTAGSGYQASNQRTLVFGLADAEQIERCIIQWPSGRTQVVEGMAPGDQVVVVEGRAALSGPGTSVPGE
jgi:hypothetical protein